MGARGNDVSAEKPGMLCGFPGDNAKCCMFDNALHTPTPSVLSGSTGAQRYSSPCRTRDTSGARAGASWTPALGDSPHTGGGVVSPTTIMTAPATQLHHPRGRRRRGGLAPPPRGARGVRGAAGVRWIGFIFFVSLPPPQGGSEVVGRTLDLGVRNYTRPGQRHTAPDRKVSTDEA